MHLRVLTFASAVLALGLIGRGAPRELPDELLPRPALEKLYAAELPKYDPQQYDLLCETHVLIEKYFLTDSAEDRKAITGAIEKSGLDAPTIGRMCRIHLAWPALPPGPAYVNERIGPHDVQYFLGVPRNYDRAKPSPLVIRLPAANAIITNPEKPPTADEVVKLYAAWVADELAAHPDAVVIMPLLNLDEFHGPSMKGMNTVIQAMHHVTTRVNIDPRQVYLIGHGMAAHACWNLSLHYTTYFAAINPLAGAASADWQRVRLLNLRNVLPVVWADSDDKVINPGQSGALVSVLRNFKYDVVFEQTRGMGHAPSAQVMNKCYDTLRARQRELYPQQVNLRSTRPDPTFNRIDWVQVYQPLNSGKERALHLRRGTGKIVVSENAHTIQAALTTPNKIEAKTDNVQVLRFYLNDRMMDLSKPVTIIVNTKTRFEGMVKPSIDVLLKDQLFIGRGWRYFTAAVDIDLAPAATRPSTRPTTLAATQASKLYFTTDDGKTFFAADASNRPPFSHEGKLALRAHVFTTDGGKTRFVGYLSKFSPVAEEPLVRRPGELQWSLIGSAAGQATTTVQPPRNIPPGPAVEMFP